MIRPACWPRLLASDGALLAVIALAGSAATSPDAPRQDRARAALLAADSALGARASAEGLLTALSGGLARDGYFLVEGQPILRGSEAILRQLRRDPSAGVATGRVSWSPLLAEVSADGTHGYTVGRIVVRTPGDSTAHGKYLAYWRRTPAD
ncbi:MAG TPA: hypothetical protein VNK43_05430, partial [Gemmatimonadales bacterium]|nr:hypothetical protein [Gemmatimonadales bacterium]